MSAMPVMIVILCAFAIAYRYYSAFIAAKVAVLDDTQKTPAVLYNDGQNFHPTNKWVLFGHHFAAISGAGPLIGPVLAAQFGYMPGLLWIVIGVCLAGAVQDFLVLIASIRRGGKSLAQIAFSDVGKVAGTAATAAIIFIIILALAGLGKVVVKALGGEKVNYGVAGMIYSDTDLKIQPRSDKKFEVEFTKPSVMTYEQGARTLNLSRGMKLVTKDMPTITPVAASDIPTVLPAGKWVASVPVPVGSEFYAPGSPWGTFTIAATIPIALLVGLWMYKIRPGKVVEASIVGGALTIGATIAGAWVAEHPFGQIFNLTNNQVTWTMGIYGFVAAVLPVWVLLAPRDYLSSFLKIGTIGLLVIGTLLANPKLEAPAINMHFIHKGPTVSGPIFPFLFITIMCGAISGFHALVSSGTTPKMIAREGQARMVGYGAMLIEALVGVVAMIAAASLPTNDYYAMNTELAKVPEFHDSILKVGGGGGIEHIGMWEQLTSESLRGRTGGAVTLAVGMAHIFDQAVKKISTSGEAAMQSLWKYWYHFAIMFEALFILTTIDAGTRIGRFLLQEVAGKIHPKLGRTDWWPGAIVSTLVIVLGWGWFLGSNSFDEVWKMFGIANQMLAVIALAIVSAFLINSGRIRYIWVTAAPLAVVLTTTCSAALYMLVPIFRTCYTQLTRPGGPDGKVLFDTSLRGALIIAMLVCALIVIAGTVGKALRSGSQPAMEPAKENAA